MMNGSTQVTQLKAMTGLIVHGEVAVAQRVEQPKPNHTGLPDKLKAGVEALSGMSMDNVRVNYNSAKPAALQAHAYAQGAEIHLGPGQEKHLPHEAWHVVQQMQGRVRPTMQMKGGVGVNDDVGLEREADAMGARVTNWAGSNGGAVKLPHQPNLIRWSLDASRPIPADTMQLGSIQILYPRPNMRSHSRKKYGYLGIRRFFIHIFGRVPTVYEQTILLRLWNSNTVFQHLEEFKSAMVHPEENIRSHQADGEMSMHV